MLGFVLAAGFGWPATLLAAAPPATALTILTPTGTTVTVSPPQAPDVFIADSNDNQVVEIPAHGRQTTVGTGLSIPQGVAVDAAGDVFIADTGNDRVVEVPADGGPEITVGAASNLSLNTPEGVAVDAAGDLFIADTGNGRVVKVPANGGTPTTIGSGLSETFNPIPASGPFGVAVDAAGDVFIADTGHNQVVEIPASGAQTTVGTGLNQPTGVATDAAGNVFITDAGNDQVVEVHADGSPQTTVASGLSSPQGVAVDAAGDVFIADSNNNQVIEVPQGGSPTTVGTAFSTPTGVAVDVPPTLVAPGQTITVKATVMTSPAGGSPSGSVTFDDGTTTLGTAALDGSNSATDTFNTTGFVVGEHPITATYDGDRLRNAPSPASAPIRLDVDQAPAITSAGAATLTAGEPGSFTVTTSGFPHPTIAEPQVLPTGVALTDNGDGTTTLAGTPAAGTGGVYDLTLTASNGVQPDATQTLTLTIDEAPTIATPSGTTFTVGEPGSFSVIAVGFPDPTLTESGILPSGVRFANAGNAAGTVAGTPAPGTGGTYSVTFTASNGVQPDATETFTLAVDEPLGFTGANTALFTVGQPGTFTVTTRGFPSPALTESGALPSGITFTANAGGTATLAGTPAPGTAGTYPVLLAASNGIGPPLAEGFTLTVGQAPAITSADTVTFTVGQAGAFFVTTSGFPNPTLTESGPLPRGVIFTGLATPPLSGTPAAGTGGTYPITVTASNPSGSATQSLTLIVDGPPAITSPASATFTIGEAGRFLVTTVPGFPTPTAPTTLTASGKLPAGLSFHDNGDGTATLTGTPAKGTHGTYPLTLTATNSAGSATQTLNLKVRSVGYNLVGADGGVFVFAPPGTGATGGFHGSLPGQGIHVTDIVGMVGSANGSGYALVGSDGGVFNFGSGAPFHGSLPGEKITVENIVGIALDAGGQGYVMTSSTGVVYGHFGNTTAIAARGTPAVTTAANPVTGIAVTPDGTGYWLVEKNGQVIAGGSAKSFGSVATTSAVSIVATADAKGYWITNAAGQVFNFGDALKLPDLVSTGQHPTRPIVALVATADQKGYLLVGAGGNVYAFGDALFNGSLPAIKVVPALPVVGGVLTVG